MRAKVISYVKITPSSPLQGKSHKAGQNQVISLSSHAIKNKEYICLVSNIKTNRYLH